MRRRAYEGVAGVSARSMRGRSFRRAAMSGRHLVVPRGSAVCHETTSWSSARLLDTSEGVSRSRDAPSGIEDYDCQRAERATACSTDLEDALHSCLGVSGHGAEIGVRAFLLEADDELRRRPRLDQGRRAGRDLTFARARVNRVLTFARRTSWCVTRRCLCLYRSSREALSLHRPITAPSLRKCCSEVRGLDGGCC